MITKISQFHRIIIIVKCLLKSNVARVILLTKCIDFAYYNLWLTWYKKTKAKTASTNFIWLYFVFSNSFAYLNFE